jgi:hypothetical protein
MMACFGSTQIRQSRRTKLREMSMLRIFEVFWTAAKRPNQAMVPGFWSTAFFLLMAMPMTSGADLPPIPKHFTASIGGFLGSSYQLELQGDTLTYTTSGAGHSNSSRVTVTPTVAQWRDFREALDALKVWQWRADYPTNGTVDGTQWTLDIAYADRALKTHGNNSYPDSTGKPNGTPAPTKAFNLYLAAIQKLTDGKTFQ